MQSVKESNVCQPNRLRTFLDDEKSLAYTDGLHSFVDLSSELMRTETDSHSVSPKWKETQEVSGKGGLLTMNSERQGALQSHQNNAPVDTEVLGGRGTLSH